MNMRSVLVLSSLAASVAAVGCGGSDTLSSSPTAPSASAVADTKGGPGSGGAPATTGSVSGTIGGLSGSCPAAVTFTLGTKTIKTSASTSFGDGKCADLKNGMKVAVVGTAQADGAILATLVRIPPPPPPPSLKSTGTISGFGGTCPAAVTFTLEGKTIKTSASTSFGDGKCADLKNGMKVGVVGTAQADGSILATLVRIAPPAVPSVTGVITALTGICPALTITVGATSATTTSTTVFDGKACPDLAVGMKVRITGTVPTGGTTLVADRVTSRR